MSNHVCLMQIWMGERFESLCDKIRKFVEGDALETGHLNNSRSVKNTMESLQKLFRLF